MVETKPFGLRLDDGSRMSGDVHVRFCEGLGVKFPRATHRVPRGTEKDRSLSKSVTLGEMEEGPPKPLCRERL